MSAEVALPTATEAVRQSSSTQPTLSEPMPDSAPFPASSSAHAPAPAPTPVPALAPIPDAVPIDGKLSIVDADLTEVPAIFGQRYGVQVTSLDLSHNRIRFENFL